MASVIIADDDKLFRDIFRHAFSQLGHSVVLAASGQEALSHAGKAQIDLILLDLKMPGLNGFQVCEQLRLMPAYQTTPIVILSALVGNKIEQAIKQAGGTLFISKPFSILSAMKSMEHCLK